jgi:hypothetical protein
MENLYQIPAGKLKGKGRLGDLEAEDDIRNECGSMNWTHLAQKKFELLRIW